MSDLISRQEAINAVLHYTIRIPGYMSEWGRKHTAAIKKDLMDDIEAIPPAQQWIPVSERLPEKEGYYLLTVESLIAEAGSVVISRPYNGRGGFCDVYWNNVVAWMPLPEPYKEENNEQVQG